MIVLPQFEEPRISIIVPTRSIELVCAALTSLEADSTSDVPFETIVVVNGRGDDLVEALVAAATGIRIVCSSVDRGVAGGYNLGRRWARGDLIVMMHDDVEVESGWLRAWLDAADNRPEAGVIGSKVLFPDGRLRGAGNILWRDGTTSPPWRGEPASPEQFDHPRYVDYSASCSLLVRASTWDAVGGLNEDLYPAYYVDVDLAMAARQLGWSVLYWPESRVRHRSVDSGQKRWRSFAAARNRERFMARWGDVVDQQPVNDGDIGAAIERAASRVSGGVDSTAGPRALPARGLAACDDAFYRARDRELTASYVRHLEATLDAAESRIEQLSAELAVVSSRETGSDPVYELGTRLEFRAGGTGSSFRSVGGHAPELWGRWLGDEPFVLELRLAEFGSSARGPFPSSLELELIHYICRIRPVSRVAIDVDGERVLEQVSRDGVSRCEAPLPPADVGYNRGRIMTIAISSDSATAPLAAGDSPDPRPLSIGLVALTVR